jgi:hypothetical protein
VLYAEALLAKRPHGRVGSLDHQERAGVGQLPGLGLTISIASEASASSSRYCLRSLLRSLVRQPAS